MNGIDFVRSRKETAKILSISLATLARLEKAGQMPPRINQRPPLWLCGFSY